MDPLIAKSSVPAGSLACGGFLVIWEFLVKLETRPAFEEVYGSEGDWARLFRQSSEFLGTQLLRDLDRPERCLTLDQWKSRDAFMKFKQSNESAYRILDQQCETLTEHEALVGEFEPVGSLRR